MEIALDRFGRMVLPKVVRDDFGLRPGDKLDAQEQGDTIVLRPVRAEGVVQNKNGLLVVSSPCKGSIENAVDIHRRDRVGRAAGWGARH